MGGRRLTVREKVALVRAAARLGDVALACRRAGVSRDSFYRWRRALGSRGEAGLRPAPRALPSRRVSPAVEAAVLRLARQRPELSKARAARELYRSGVSPTGVRSVWLRHGVGTTRRDRLSWASAHGYRPKREADVECPACHRSFAAGGPPPFTCPHCGVGGVPR